MLKVHSPSIKPDINAGINGAIQDDAKVLHVHNRLCSVRGSEVVAASARAVLASYRERKSLVKKHPEASQRGKETVKPVLGQESNVLHCCAPEILNLWSGLSAVGFKCERR